MIKEIREALENGSLEAVDHISIDNVWDKDIRHIHRIMLKNTRTGEQVLVGIFKEEKINNETDN